VRILADYTFTLYMIHLPVILFVSAAIGVEKPWTSPATILAVGIVTALLGYFTEHQRHRLKRQVERLLAIIHKRRSVSAASLTTLALALVVLGASAAVTSLTTTRKPQSQA
jgi:peptidoglycan/LPS O-acetylase OafA/YrhL